MGMQETTKQDDFNTLTDVFTRMTVQEFIKYINKYPMSELRYETEIRQQDYKEIRESIRQELNSSISINNDIQIINKTITWISWFLVINFAILSWLLVFFFLVRNE